MPSTTDRSIAGRYALQSALGSGAMGTVWLAEDSLLKRRVAVKEVDIPPGINGAERDAVEARLLREARAAARLSHPGVVSVYDVVEHSNRPWIVMEYVDAPTLEEKIKESGPLSPDEAAQVGLQLLEILEVAHAEGIVHRDVKPGNVMCKEDGQVKLADFGIASVQDDPKITQTGFVLGSPSFMAPEQASKGTSGPEGDLWSLGATLYQAVECEPPFDRGAPLPTLTAVMTEDPRPMERAGWLAPAILALLQKEPSARPTIPEARRMLERLDTPIANTAATTAAAAPVLAPTAVEQPVPTRKAGPSAAPARARRQPEDGARTWWPWIALAFVIAALIAIPLLMQGDDPSTSAEGRKNRGGQQGQAAGGANEDDTGTDTSEQTDTTGTTEGWVTYTDPGSGYVIEYPEGWEPVQRDTNTIDFTDPGSGTYLRVAWTDAPGDDVMTRLEEIEEKFAAGHDGYGLIQMTPTEFLGHEAGLWEYTYEEGVALHAYNLQFVVDDAYGFALNFQTREENWAGSQDLWESLKATFRPPS